MYGNIELDSLYADLLNDYLNFFLPINDRDVNFPNFSDFNKSKSKMASASPIPTHKHHSSLLKRVVQKTLTEDNLDMLTESDRIGDMKKVDLFLRLLVEFLVVSFTDQAEKSPSSSKQFDSHPMINRSILGFSKISENNSNLANIYSKNLSLLNSPVKTNDPKEYLATVEVIFALSMILKHFHLFSLNGQLSGKLFLFRNKPFDQIKKKRISLTEWNDRKHTRFMENTMHESPIDELRS